MMHGSSEDWGYSPKSRKVLKWLNLEDPTARRAAEGSSKFKGMCTQHIYHSYGQQALISFFLFTLTVDLEIDNSKKSRYSVYSQEDSQLCTLASCVRLCSLWILVLPSIWNTWRPSKDPWLWEKAWVQAAWGSKWIDRDCWVTCSNVNSLTLHFLHRVPLNMTIPRDEESSLNSYEYKYKFWPICPLLDINYWCWWDWSSSQSLRSVIW